MKQFTAPLLVLLAIVVLGSVAQALYWTQLPDRVAIHFDAQGQPNQWASKPIATVLSLGLQVGLPLMFTAIALVMPRLPDWIINIPHREYWLAAERRGQSLAWVTKMMLWFAATNAIFIAAINHVTFLANRSGTPLLAKWFWSVLGIYLLVTAVGVFNSYYRFKMPD
jgi:uncharacterized membrane protein